MVPPAARRAILGSQDLFWVASCTPCDKNLTFDPAAFNDVLAWFKHNGADGVVVLGTTGEYPSFGTAERKAVMEVAGKSGMNHLQFGHVEFHRDDRTIKHAADHGAEDASALLLQEVSSPAW